MADISRNQYLILQVLLPTAAPFGLADSIAHQPRTSDIIMALGLRRDPSGLASVSNSLTRLENLGLVDGHYGQIHMQGKARRWRITPEGERVLSAKMNAA